MPLSSRKESSRSLGRAHSSKQVVLVVHSSKQVVLVAQLEERAAHSRRVELAELQLDSWAR